VRAPPRAAPGRKRAVSPRLARVVALRKAKGKAAERRRQRARAAAAAPPAARPPHGFTSGGGRARARRVRRSARARCAAFPRQPWLSGRPLSHPGRPRGVACCAPRAPRRHDAATRRLAPARAPPACMTHAAMCTMC
jgi:hypothetical protein